MQGLRDEAHLLTVVVHHEGAVVTGSILEAFGVINELGHAFFLEVRRVHRVTRLQWPSLGSDEVAESLGDGGLRRARWHRLDFHQL